MKTRVITGALLLLFFIPIFVFGGIVFDIVLGLMAMVATWELSRMFKKGTSKPDWIMYLEVVFSGGLFYLIKEYYQNGLYIDGIFYYITFVLIVMSLLLVFVENFSSKEFGHFFINVLYPALGFGALHGLRVFDPENGLFIIGFLFMITVMTDIFAYVVGINFGKHRLAVKISPKKSIEGSIGGTFFAIVFTVIYIMVVQLDTIGSISLSLGTSIILIFVISCIGQIGDLIASKLKRDCDVKDYSQLFPGHGGVMDRFDSAIFAAMVLMLIVQVVGLWM